MVNVSNIIVLEDGKLIPLDPGDALVVEYSFDYTVGEATDITLWVSLGLGIGRDIEGFDTLYLEEALTSKTYQGSFELVIPTGVAKGAYWMKVEIDGTEITVPDAVVISGVPGMLESFAPLLMLGLLFGVVSMVAPKTKEGV